MITNITSAEVAHLAVSIFGDALVFLLPSIAGLAGIHIVYSLIMNVLFRDRI